MHTGRNFVKLVSSFFAALSFSAASTVSTLDYPTRPVRWVVGHPAGGSTDIFARRIGNRLPEKLGQQFIIESEPGAGNDIATESLVKGDTGGDDREAQEGRERNPRRADMKKRIAEVGGVPIVATSAEFDGIIQAETKWEKVVKFAGAQVE